MRKGLIAGVLGLGLVGVLPAAAQEVLLNGAPVAGSPNVVNQVAVPDLGTLVVDPGASITTNLDAVIDAVDGTTITVLNGGTITSTGNGGIDASGSTLFLTNSGTITGNLRGVLATTLTNLTNSGTITGNVDGVAAGPITNLTNSGTITGTVLGVVSTAITNLTNSGTIIGNSGTAIREIGGPANTLLTLLPGSNIQGLVDLGGGVNTLVVGNGLNMVTTFAGVPHVIATNGAPFAVQGATVAVVDPTFLGITDNLVGDLASSILSTVSNRLNEAGSGVFGLSAHDLDGTWLNVTPLAATPGDGTRGFWLKGFGGARDVDGSGPSVDTQHLFGGFVFGVDGQSMPDLRLGLFAGLSTGHVDTEFSAQDIDIDSYFAGFYGRHEKGSWWLDFAVTGGISEHDTERLVANNQVPGGINRANGDYGGYFISPEVTVGTRGDFLGYTVKPSLRARYVGAWFDDYTETGTAAPLSVDDREVHMLEGRAQLGFMVSEGPTHGLELRIGVDGRVFLGDENVDATLFAQTLSFDPGGQDESLSGFIGGHFYDQVTDSVQIFVGAEFGTGTEVGFRADAQAGVRISF